MVDRKSVVSSATRTEYPMISTIDRLDIEDLASRYNQAIDLGDPM
jgi:hypothetical protein